MDRKELWLIHAADQMNSCRKDILSAAAETFSSHSVGASALASHKATKSTEEYLNFLEEIGLSLKLERWLSGFHDQYGENPEIPADAELEEWNLKWMFNLLELEWSDDGED